MRKSEARKQSKKKEQLGMAVSTARSRLITFILFSLVQECGKDTCYQCGEKIESVEEFSVEHKVPWLDSEYPLQLYFDLDNIAFSHLSCNCRYARKANKGKRDSSKYITLYCAECGMQFEELKSLIYWRQENRNQKNFYCSENCAGNERK